MHKYTYNVYSKVFFRYIDIIDTLNGVSMTVLLYWKILTPKQTTDTSNRCTAC